MLDKIVAAGAHESTSFQAASKQLRRQAELEVCPKQIERLVHRIGGERCAQRDAAVSEWRGRTLPEQRSCPLPQPPAVAVVQADGGRLQIFNRTAVAPAASPAAPSAMDTPGASPPDVLPFPCLPDESPTALESAAAALAASFPAEPETAVDEREIDDEPCTRHWREDKVGCLMTMLSVEQAADPCPQIPECFVQPTRILKLVRGFGRSPPADAAAAPDSDEPHDKKRPGVPEPLVKSVAASRAAAAEFGEQLAAAAWARGFFAALRKAFLGDGAAMLWRMHAAHFSHFIPILDFIHALSYVFAAAMAGRTFAAGWPVYERWIQQVWSGRVDDVLAALAVRQQELGTPTSNDGEGSPRRVVATTLRYLTRHRERMHYAEYRRLGLPIMTSYVESTVKLVGKRVKGTEKLWSEEGAEAVLQLHADYLGDLGAMDEFWARRSSGATGQRKRCAA